MQDPDILEFWFNELTPADWWKKSHDLDTLIKNRFHHVHTQAAQGELFAWREHASGALAEIIILDQFSRNIFRDTPASFAYDGMALVLAQQAIAKQQDSKLDVTKRSFIYMPFMHSESLLIHEQAEHLFNQPGMDSSYEFERKHADIIKRFGRYPHRNNILGRESTADEVLFLQGPGSSF